MSAGARRVLNLHLRLALARGKAKRFYRTATDWLDRFENPTRAANIVSHCGMSPWAGLGQALTPIDDPRRNAFDWESWHECDVFRAEIERLMRAKP
jgi:hypothetical protein